MRTPFITAGAIAAALALNSISASGEEHLNPSRANLAQEPSTGFVGRLVSLHDYLAKGDQAISTNRTTSPGTPSGLNSSRPPAPSGTLEAIVRDRTDALAPNPRYEADSQGSRLANPSEAGLDRMNGGSSQSQTFVLIVQQGSIPNVHLQSPRPGSGQIPETQPNSDPQSVAGSTAIRSTGQAYILLFDENPASQSAYLRAKRLLADGISNWATSPAEAVDRLPVRGRDDADTTARRNEAPQQQPGQTSRADVTGLREPAGRWSKDSSEVRVTGRLMSRGGIQAIQVSEMSSANMPNDASLRPQGTLDRLPAKPSDDKR